MERGARERLPVVLFTANGGGARMQEGLLSLMQMAKTSAAVARLDREAVPYIVVLTDPTMAGVYASYASLGDVILAEPGALIGFAGRRVGNQDMGVKLPDDFQTSEFQFRCGMVDRVVPRKEMRSTLGKMLAFFAEETGECSTTRLISKSPSPNSIELIAELKQMARNPDVRADALAKGHRYRSRNRRSGDAARGEACGRFSRNLTPWNEVQMARHTDRPYTLDYIRMLFDDFLELHGDRTNADDPAIVGGLAQFRGESVVVLGHQKGARPEGAAECATSAAPAPPGSAKRCA